MDSSEDEEEEKTAGGNKKAAGAKFRPPQNVPQFFEESRTGEEMEREVREKRKRRAISRSIMDDLKEQYLDTPEEVSHKVTDNTALSCLAFHC